MHARWLFAAICGLTVVGFVAAADTPDLAKRHGLEADLKTYPQATPKEALAAVVKALENKKADYFSAHLADPEFVDKRLAETAAQFPEFVAEVSARLVKDPAPLKQMRRFLEAGVWDTKEDRAVVKLQDVPDRCLYLRRVGGRWFLENRFQPELKK